MLLAVQKYDIKVIHRPGKSKDLIIADTLSRAFLPEENTDHDETDIDLDTQVYLLVSNLPFSGNKLKEFKIATNSDQTLQKLKSTVLDGWPDFKEEIGSEIRPFWDFREEIHVAEGLLFKGEKLIVPKSKQRETLEKKYTVTTLESISANLEQEISYIGQGYLVRYMICVANVHSV